MRNLLAHHGDHEQDARLEPADLPAAYGLADDTGWFVRLNFVATVDGSVVGADHRSGSINNDVDGLVFQMLRAWADVVVVGAGTARAEEYDAPITDERWTSLRAGRPPHPAMAVLSTHGELPPGMDTMARSDVFALDTSGPDGVQRAFHQLRRRGYERVLLEGGPTVTSLALAASVVDEICLTTSPQLVGGSAHRMVDGDDLRLDAQLVGLIESDSTLLARWSLRAGGSAEAAH
ncbi:dihydrofolate reductase family protein [Yimella sp. cx-51]|uniref:dihydrofolate reductase family protein n=1 Tax=Yimella sp. cx-51 TaxID=2770551 RepID=UPI00165DB642|nr:dihydrofolate reductase family protein [Yimella sp. cx-51]MBC9957681.1 dihydrofolate reductase family protein [Yimella sp. cx-51]QTH36963.1 dihydrofolate reductase family protein [Yimella sp. cx-51]